MSRRRGRASHLVAPIAAAALVITAGVYLYNRYAKEKRGAGESPSSGTSVSPATKISLVVSKTLVESGIPLEILITKYPNLVVVIHDQDELSAKQLSAQVAPEFQYKVINCDTEAGIVHVLKHLRSDLVVLPPNISGDVKDQIRKFVGKVELLSESIEESNKLLHDLFFS
ncbi:hypothetical protein TRVA0_040S01002 [Trichomonascus vanleenenianus]|uniref:uncharacterized protein n=1 Tax=Trichomonascus vanleenenianus TaxID=2268995 RepID=UPI003ECA7F6E